VLPGRKTHEVGIRFDVDNFDAWKPLFDGELAAVDPAREQVGFGFDPGTVARQARGA
jgi:hypothetical protein